MIDFGFVIVPWRQTHTMQIKIGARLMLANLLILGVSLAVFGVLLQQEVDPGILILFSLLTAVASLALTPLLLPWICLRDLRAIQTVIAGLKRGDYAVPLPIAPEPGDPDDEYELNRLKREIHWMRRAIAKREQDIRRQTERILALNEALRIEAITDTLTGLYNARHFWECIGQCFNEHLHTGVSFAFVILDIDFFKRINDTHGHLGGDRVLEQFASALRESTRKTDIVARIGGEEFALILHNVSSDETKQYLHRLHGLLRERDIRIGPEQRIKVTASVGYYVIEKPLPPALTVPPITTTQDIVKRADDALYWVKNNGRNGIMAWHELTHDYRDQRLELTTPTSATCPCRRIPAPPCAVSSDVDAA